MRKNSVISLLALLLSACLLSAQEPNQGSLKDLIQQIQSHPDADFSKYIGKVFVLEGDLYGPRKDLHKIRLEIYVPAPDGKGNVDSGIIAEIAMDDTSKIIHFPAGSLAIKSTAVLQSVDPKSKTITLKSDAVKTYVNEAD